MNAFPGAALGLLLLAAAARADEPRICPPRTEYVRYCAACHGENADGNGPAASALSPRPPALTGLHAKFGRPLSTDLVVYLEGSLMPRAHGTSAMPVWGTVLRSQSGDERKDAVLLFQIVNYLECIQKD